MTGDATDVVSGHTGTVVGGITFSGGQAQVSATTEYISLPNTIFGSYTSVTIEMWFSTTSATITTAERLFQFGASATGNPGITIYKYGGLATGGYGLYYASSTGATAYLNANMGGTFASQTNVQIVLTLPAASYPQVYLNGVLVYTSTVTMSTLPVPSYFYLGQGLEGAPSADQFYGSIDDVRIWGGVLSASDILTSFIAGPSK